MKNLIQLLSFCLLIILSGCEKEVIPEPNVDSTVVNSPALYVMGDFDGVSKSIVIDGSSYFGDSYFYDSPQDTIGYWAFDIHNSDSLFIPEFGFQILNHEQSTTFNYSDLVESTDSSFIEFANGFAPFPNQYSEIVIIYSPTQADLYFSDLSPINSPLNVLEAKDTIVGNEQFRILELSGDIVLTHFNSLDQISIDNFHARIAFSL
jgi:hypothetical protein